MTDRVQDRHDTLERQLGHERDYVGQLYARLDEMRVQKTEQLAQVRRAGAVGSAQNVSERDAFATLYEDRLAQLYAVEDRLVFGRLDMDSGETRYIGRIGMSTDDLQRLMVDWRAPEAGTFYQATAFDRQGVRRRRHLMLRGRTVRALEDDVLDAAMLGEDGVVPGEGALLAALNERRTGRMGDIVSTIQAEQDAVIRSPLPGVLVVQGGPGTGKTAVALHRAAYLLYSHRDRLAKSGVLLVGPSDSFLTYIERVLPSLGETGVIMTSPASLIPDLHAGPEPDARVARIKGGLVMADVVAAAVRNRQRVPAEPRRLDVNGFTLSLTPRQVARARDRAQATGKAHNEARLTFVKILLRELTDQLTQKVEASSGKEYTGERSWLAEDVRTSRDVRVALNLSWMPLTAKKLVDDLLSRPEQLAAAAAGLLAEEDWRVLLREPGAPFTEADVPLLDEAAELVGDLDASAGRDSAARDAARTRDLANAEKALENMNQTLADAGVDGMLSAEDVVAHNAAAEATVTTSERALADRTWAFGHVIVDEAQELSPMQWRLLMRRCPLKSFTIVGDIAQTSSAAGATSWAEALAPFVGDRFTLQELTVNYRTPAQIAEAAVAVARATGAPVSEPEAVRVGDWPPLLQPARRSGELPAAVVAAVAEDVDLVDGGLVAVIAPSGLVPRLRAALQDRWGARIGGGAGSVDQSIVVLDPVDAKGLEFDGVIVVEPRQIMADAGGRPGDLYVAMTRPTQRLRLISSSGWPAGLEEAVREAEDAGIDERDAG
ncbi:AAA family ATPase [Tersicoccus sp. Bi-70]|uniref:HelD family protein n=1 Tax=Tersicoccus sp. Bi-70 TaxID=1897634 RepID=UPI001E55BE85|nr:AAA family ATPase [Tersicoccus sp. Bi-70]